MEDKEGEYIYEKKEINGKEKIVNRYKVGKPLGKGSFGKVYEFESEDDGVIYAGKIIDKKIFKEKNDERDEIIRIQKNKQNIQAETKIQQELKSSRILKVNPYII
jgi:serine/threonine protein kinase